MNTLKCLYSFCSCVLCLYANLDVHPLLMCSSSSMCMCMRVVYAYV